jgi:hypothetical protein
MAASNIGLGTDPPLPVEFDGSAADSRRALDCSLVPDLKRKMFWRECLKKLSSIEDLPGCDGADRFGATIEDTLGRFDYDRGGDCVDVTPLSDRATLSTASSRHGLDNKGLR